MTVLPSVIVILWSQAVLVPSLRSIAVSLTVELHEASIEHVQDEDPVREDEGYPGFHRKTLLSFVFKLEQGFRPWSEKQNAKSPRKCYNWWDDNTYLFNFVIGRSLMDLVYLFIRF